MKTIFFFLLSGLTVASLTGQQLYQNLSFSAGLGNSTGQNVSVSVSDYDLDGDEDFYIGRNGEANHLYQNNGDGSFTDVALAAGVAGVEEGTYSAVWGDLDNDGDPDLYVGNRLAADQLFVNNGDGTFTDITVLAGINNLDEARSVMLADVNLDGLLDIYIANFFDENVLYMNQGDLRFTNETGPRGVRDNRLNLGAMFLDYDVDGDMDLYLLHDGNQPNILYQNDGNGFFADVSVASGTDYAGFGMGVDAGDVNHDGLPDIYITNLYYNVLLLNDGDGTFTDISTEARIQDPGMGWGTTFMDFDNDGWLDIYLVNNSYFSDHDNLLYRNLGNNSFEVVSENQAISSPFGGFASATLDMDKDGKLDLLVTNYGQSGGVQYFRNNVENDHHWLQIELEGTASNRDAVGARITVEAGELSLIEEVHAGSGYAAQNSLVQHFGLGEQNLLDRVTVYWPSGATEVFTGLSADQKVLIVEGSGLVSSIRESTILAEVSLFPNPVLDRLEVRLPNELNSSGQVIVLDLLGREIFTKPFQSGTTTVGFDVSTLAAGGYLVRIAAGNEERTLKFFK